MALANLEHFKMVLWKVKYRLTVTFFVNWKTGTQICNVCDQGGGSETGHRMHCGYRSLVNVTKQLSH